MAGVRPCDLDVKAIAQADLLNSLDMPSWLFLPREHDTDQAAK
jgi:hypothetical protein